MLSSKILELSNKITIVIEVELIVIKVVIETLLESATEVFNKYRKDFLRMKKAAVLKGVSALSDSPKLNPSNSEEYFFDQSPSIVNILKLISILLGIQEQVWLIVNRSESSIPQEAFERTVSRVQTAYGRLASFISWPSDQVHPIKLTEAGLLNISDQLSSLRHYLEYNTPIEDDVLK